MRGYIYIYIYIWIWMVYCNGWYWFERIGRFI